MTLPHFHYWLDEHAFLTYLQNIFDAVDNDLGVESVAQPPPFVRLDQDVHEHFGGRRLTVVFIGNNVGVTSDIQMADTAIEGCNYQYRLAAPTLQHAHTLWTRWIDLIVNCYVKRRGMVPRAVTTIARIYLPRKKEVKQMETIVPVYPPHVIDISDGSIGGTDLGDDFVVVRSEDEVEVLINA